MNKKILLIILLVAALFFVIILMVRQSTEETIELDPKLEKILTEASKEEVLTECRAMPTEYDKEECFLYSAFWLRDSSLCDEVVTDLNQCICYAAVGVFLQKSEAEQEQILKEDPMNNEEIREAFAEQCPEVVEFAEASAAASTKTTLAGLRSSISICCSNTSNTLQTIAGAEMCSAATGAKLPTYNQLGLASAADLTYAVTAECNTDTPTITATIKNHPKEDCNGIWTINEFQVTAPPGC